MFVHGLKHGRQFDAPLAATITCTGDILMLGASFLVTTSNALVTSSNALVSSSVALVTTSKALCS